MPDLAGEYVTIGPPGTGKTTWLVKQTEKLLGDGCRVMVASLTKAAAREFASRRSGIDPECVGTLHAHCYRALGRPTLAERFLADWNDRNPLFALSSRASWEPAEPETGDRVFQDYQLRRHRRIPEREWPPEVSSFALAWSAWKVGQDAADFTDLIEQAHEVPPPGGADVMLIDEAQDLSALEHGVIQRWLDAGHLKAVIYVGDPWQALYVWRGACPELLERPLPADKCKVLAQSYRVPGRVHQIATRWIRQLSTYRPIDYHPRGSVGDVQIWPASLRHVGPAIELTQQLLDKDESVLLVTLCNHQLGPILDALRTARIPFSNPWRRRAAWNPLGGDEKLSPATFEALLRPLADVHGNIWDAGARGEDPDGAARPWTLTELQRLLCPLPRVARRGAKGRLKALIERAPNASVTPEHLADLILPNHRAIFGEMLVGRTRRNDALAWFVQHAGPRYRRRARWLADLCKQYGLEGLHREPRCFVGTIHSTKGGEADNVILFPDLSGAGALAWSSIHTRDSVVRTLYVGMTRARLRLFICHNSTEEYFPWTELIAA